MKRKVLIFCLLILGIIVIPGCSEKKEPVRIIDKKYLEVIKETRNEAIFYMARTFTPGSSIAVSVKGKIVYSEGFGLASSDLDVPATRLTKYRIGNITQVLTALTYHKMVEAGKLDPEGTVQQYYPAFPEKQYPLKLHHLVDQTSGIRTPTDEEMNWRGLNVGIKGAIDNFKNDSLLFNPGDFQYPTIFSFNLLGALMEEVENKPFARIIKEWVTDTLDMENTVSDNPLATVKGRTNFYDRDMVAQITNATFRDLRYRMPSDGYLSTTEDLLKLGNALLYGTNLPETVKEKMLTPPKIQNQIELRTGNGILFLDTRDNQKFYASRGNVTGGGSMLIIYPEDEIVVVWLANIDDSMDEMPGLMVANNFRDFLHGTFKTKEERMKEEEAMQKEPQPQE
jgi:serine beta-lactamase-like protein LACTB, mitochondrial